MFLPPGQSFPLSVIDYSLRNGDRDKKRGFTKCSGGLEIACARSLVDNCGSI